MDIKHLDDFLGSIQRLSKVYQNIARLSGEGFNMFNILKVESSEVRMHSRFITELLKPDGSHGQGDVFLKLFLKSLTNITRTKDVEIDIPAEKLALFNCEEASVSAEYFVGQINETRDEGGRIDIVIESKDKKFRILIENKIYAKDQENQLLRYKKHDKSAILFYLTLDGSLPSESGKGNLEIDKDFYLISYEIHILNWLNACLKEVATLPIIRETILQYIVLIKKLTNQLNSKGMSDEIKKLILKNPDYINVINNCKSACDQLIKDAWDDLYSMVYKGIQGKGFSISQGYMLEPCFGEDNEGVYVGLKLYNDKSSLKGTGIEGKSLFKKIKILDLKLVNGSGAFIWYNPKEFPNRSKISSESLVLFYNKDVNEKTLIVNNIIEEAQMVFDLIEKELSIEV